MNGGRREMGKLQFSTSHLSDSALQRWRASRSSSLQLRNEVDRDPLDISSGRATPPCITLDDDPMDISEDCDIEEAKDFYEFEETLESDSPAFPSEDAPGQRYPDNARPVPNETSAAIKNLQLRVRSLEANRTEDHKELAALKTQVDELRNKRRSRYNLRYLESIDDHFSDSSDYEYSIKWPNLSKKTVVAIERRLKTLRCRGIVYRELNEWCKTKSIHSNPSLISKFFTKKLNEEKSRQWIKFVSQFLKEKAVGVVPEKVLRIFKGPNRSLPTDVRNFIEQCIRKMAEREISNTDLVNWAKEQGVVWNAKRIQLFLDEKLNETESRDMILHLEAFLEDA